MLRCEKIVRKKEEKKKEEEEEKEEGGGEGVDKKLELFLPWAKGEGCHFFAFKWLRQIHNCLPRAKGPAHPV